MLKRVLRSLAIRANKLGRYRYDGVVHPNDKRLISLNSESSFFDPFVFEDADTLVITCSDRKNNSIISFDGIDAKRKTTLLQPCNNGWEDRVNRACIVKRGQNYYMWYTGQCDGRSCIGLAISTDGKEYVRFADKPVIVPTLINEKCSVMNPSVLFDSESKMFKMWYSGGDFYEPDYIFYAESFDGINWKKRENPVLLKGKEKYDCYKVGGCDVHRMSDGSYVMYYIGYENIDVARICRAFSYDGIDWERDKLNPLVCPTKKSWDADSCYKPSYYFDNLTGSEYIFYNGRKGNIEQIGYALLEKKYE